MERQLDFTIDEINFSGLADYVTKIRTEYDMRFIIILDPAISADEGTDPEKTRVGELLSLDQKTPFRLP